MITELKAKLSAIENVQRIEERRLKASQETLRALSTHKELLELGVKLCAYCLEEQIEVTKHIEDMASVFMSVFDDPLAFEFVTAYKTDGVTVSGVKSTITLDGAPDRASEGQKTVASLALLLAFLKLKPGLTQTMIFDEFLADVSTTVVPSLVELVEQLDTQVIMVTHQDVEFPLTYRVFKKGSTSYLEKVN